MLEHPFRIIQANLNRNQAATETVLDIAVREKADIVAVQEPWLLRDNDKGYKGTRSTAHQAFNQIILPLHDPSTRPRTMLYVSTRTLLDVSPILEDTNDGDLLPFTISDRRGGKVQVVNLYNEKDQEGQKTIDRALYSLPLLPNSLVLGDFNVRHPSWDPRGHDSASNLLGWLEDNDFTLRNEIGVGTFFRPHLAAESVLDLAFTKGSLSQHDVNWRTINVGSDHLAISLDIQGTSQTGQREKKKVLDLAKADWDLFQSTLLAKSMSINFSSSESMANSFTSCITQATKEAIPERTIDASSKRWWTPELRALRRQMSRSYRTAFSCGRNPEDLERRSYLQARNKYFQAIKTAKKDHWNAFLEKEDPKSIFKAMAYTKSSSRRQIPTIDQQSSFEGKCNAFTKTLFPAPPHQEPLPTRWASYTEGSWEWPCLAEEELATACSSSKVKGKTPGPDNITQAIISKAYQAIPITFLRVYSTLIDNGYHPLCWKVATGAILAKPGKPDYSKPKAYRVISLLNCLGKVSERILAQRLGRLAETTPLLDDSQLGGRKKKSAVDAALLLTNEVENNRLKGHKTSAVFMDVKGAFDHVAKNRLLQTMIHLKLPHNLVRWVQSFLSNRKLRLAFDGKIEGFKEVEIGIPQGSPISPILFLIYIRDIFAPLQDIRPLSYIDDIALITSSTSLQKNARILEREVARLTALGEENSIAFDLAKTELIHFSKGKDSERAITLPSNEVIYPATGPIRWLGVWFDPLLSFKDHVRIRTAQALAAFHRLERLANTERGLSAASIRKIYLACVTTVADYGSPVWWRSKRSNRPLTVMQNKASRKVLGVFRTAPSIPSEREANLFPPDLRLELQSLRYAFRSLQLPPTHPLCIAISNAPDKQRRVQRQDYTEIVPQRSRATQLQSLMHRLQQYSGAEGVPTKLLQAKRDLVNGWRTRYEREQQKRQAVAFYPNPSSYLARMPWTSPLKFRARGLQGRHLTSAFYTLLIGHGYLKDYLFRLNLTANPRCRCGRKETAEHLVLSCPEYRLSRPTALQRAQSLVEVFTKQDLKEDLFAFLKATGIATRKWHLQRNEEEVEEEEEQSREGEAEGRGVEGG